MHVSFNANPAVNVSLPLPSRSNVLFGVQGQGGGPVDWVTLALKPLSAPEQEMLHQLIIPSSDFQTFQKALSRVLISFQADPLGPIMPINFDASLECVDQQLREIDNQANQLEKLKNELEKKAKAICTLPVLTADSGTSIEKLIVIGVFNDADKARVIQLSKDSGVPGDIEVTVTNLAIALKEKLTSPVAVRQAVKPKNWFNALWKLLADKL